MSKTSKQAYNFEEMLSQVNASVEKANRIQLHTAESTVFTLKGSTITEKILTHTEYGESLAINGTLEATNNDEYEAMVGKTVAFYLNGKRREVYEEKVNAGMQVAVAHFICGASITLKSGRNYIPLNVVVETQEGA